MRETKYSQKLYKAIRKLNLDKEELKELLLCLYINGCPQKDCAILFGTTEEKVVKFLESEEIYGYQVCRKCGRLKDEIRDFRQYEKWKIVTCEVCEKEYFDSKKERKKKYDEEYRENNKERKKEYRENNKEKIKEYNKGYRESNKDYYQNYNKEYYNNGYHKSNASIEQVQKLAMFEEVSGNQIKCKYCGRWVVPTISQVHSRLQGIEDDDKNYIYCSDQCKQECPVYDQKKYPKGFKPASSREVNPVLRQIVLERDEYTCQKCHKTQDELTVGLHCHHITPYADSPIETDDPENCITFCKDCHQIVHKIPGCTYQELKCG